MCGTPARRSRAARRSCARRAATVLATVEIYDRLEAIVDLGVPNIALAEYKAPENFKASACPLCAAAVPITQILKARRSASEREARRLRALRTFVDQRGTEPQVSDGALLDLRPLHPHLPVPHRAASRPGSRRSAATGRGRTGRRRRGSGCRWPARDRRSAGSREPSAARTADRRDTGPTFTVLQSPPFGTDRLSSGRSTRDRVEPWCGNTAGARRPSASAPCRRRAAASASPAPSCSAARHRLVARLLSPASARRRTTGCPASRACRARKRVTYEQRSSSW